jgi:hypothetical protein
MDRNRIWKILNRNLRGINSENKWVALASKIEESNCDIICSQETKRYAFDLEYIRNFCPKKSINLNTSINWCIWRDYYYLVQLLVYWHTCFPK